MSRLTVFADDNPGTPTRSTTDALEMTRVLAGYGIDFKRFEIGDGLAEEADQETILAAYAKEVSDQCHAFGYTTADVVRVPRGTPDAGTMRVKYRAEHIHDEDEARLIVAGSGTFSLHLDGKVLQVACGRGDLIRVPAGTLHWFDMGAAPFVTAIRFFTRPDGWVAQFTGDTISDRFPEHVS